VSVHRSTRGAFSVRRSREGATDRQHIPIVMSTPHALAAEQGSDPRRAGKQWRERLFSALGGRWGVRPRPTPPADAMEAHRGSSITKGRTHGGRRFNKARILKRGPAKART
jgi:hypothetical protein